MTFGLETLSTAFRRCVGELGMWSASRLFVETARAHGGEEAVHELREALGAEFPVLDVVGSAGDVVAGNVARASAPAMSGVDQIVALCQEMRRIVVVGLEADCLGALLERVPDDVELALLLDATFPVDDERIRASWARRMTLTDLSSFQRFAGTRSALLTTLYGSDRFNAVVPRIWLRLHGEDVRTQFRLLIGWNVIGQPMERYPRWLVETDVADFTDIVEP